MTMETFLAPVENPQDPALKEAYANYERMFGKVITPVKVFSSRLDAEFSQFFGIIGVLDKKLTLPKESAMLVRLQVARLNVCEFCMDIKRWEIIHSSMNQAKFDSLDRYQTSGLFSEKEKAVLDYVTALTRDKKVSHDTFECLAVHFSEREICEIVYLVATEHVYNMANIGLNIHSDMLCDLSQKN
jgi:alkylhydroperoxidase family enzyme